MSSALVLPSASVYTLFPDTTISPMPVVIIEFASAKLSAVIFPFVLTADAFTNLLFSICKLPSTFNSSELDIFSID